MPEYPDITVYIEALSRRVLNQPLEAVRLASPFLLRSVAPPVSAAEGKRVTGFRRVGKRIAIGVEGDTWLVLHLMIAGRLHWGKRGAKLGGKRSLAAFDFPDGCILLTEAGTQRRASLHMAQSDAGLAALDPGGLDLFTAPEAEFAARLTAENHTLKRVLTDPRVFSGVGNAYSDEILHRARLSPIALSQKLDPAAIATLFDTTKTVLLEWTARLRAEAGDGFPESVTAFRPEMAVHGKYNQPCPVCQSKVQRIRYAANETNYCPTCQTGGKLLADRALSRLMGKDWPKTPEELELLKSR